MMKNDGAATALTCLKYRLIIRAASVIDDHDRRKICLCQFFYQLQQPLIRFIGRNDNGNIVFHSCVSEYVLCMAVFLLRSLYRFHAETVKRCFRAAPDD